MTAIFETPLYPYARSEDQDVVLSTRHQVVIIGAGPVGLAAAIDLGQRDIPVVVLDDNDRVSTGSRAICFSKRTLEIADRLGIGDALVEKGVTWQRGRVFHGDDQTYDFDLLPEPDHKHPAFINLQQYYLEQFLVERIRLLQSKGAPIELRGKNRVEAIGSHDDHVTLEITTPEGPYNIEADWLIACDGALSPTRRMLGIDFIGQVFEDNFLIADVVMQADFPSERWFWFDPPFNRGQSALLHKQPDGVWRIDLQLGWDIDPEVEKRPENVLPRLRAMLGEEVEFSLEWVSIYTFQCRRMEKFRHGRVLFAGDSAHQVSPFGARGANSGLEDVDNLGWKLSAVLSGDAPEALLDSYNQERTSAADENIRHSTGSTDFITPKSDVSRVFRDAVLNLSTKYEFARPLVNSGRLSTPAEYDETALSVPDTAALPDTCRPGKVAPDAPFDGGWLLDRLGGEFTLLAIGAGRPPTTLGDFDIISVKANDSPILTRRYLGDQPTGIYLIRPDQYIAARWDKFDVRQIKAAHARARGIQ